MQAGYSVIELVTLPGHLHISFCNPTTDPDPGRPLKQILTDSELTNVLPLLLSLVLSVCVHKAKSLSPS